MSDTPFRLARTVLPKDILDTISDYMYHDYTGIDLGSYKLISKFDYFEMFVDFYQNLYRNTTQCPYLNDTILMTTLLRASIKLDKLDHVINMPSFITEERRQILIEIKRQPEFISILKNMNWSNPTQTLTKTSFKKMVRQRIIQIPQEMRKVVWIVSGDWTKLHQLVRADSCNYLEWLTNEMGIYCDNKQKLEAINSAIWSRSLNALDWLKRRFNLTSRTLDTINVDVFDRYEYFTNAGDIIMSEWLERTFDLGGTLFEGGRISSAFARACEDSDLRMVEWLSRTYCLTKKHIGLVTENGVRGELKKAFHQACMRGNIDLLNVLQDIFKLNRVKLGDDLMTTYKGAYNANNYALLKWFYTTQ